MFDNVYLTKKELAELPLEARLEYRKKKVAEFQERMKQESYTLWAGKAIEKAIDTLRPAAEIDELDRWDYLSRIGVAHLGVHGSCTITVDAQEDNLHSRAFLQVGRYTAEQMDSAPMEYTHQEVCGRIDAHIHRWRLDRGVGYLGDAPLLARAFFDQFVFEPGNPRITYVSECNEIGEDSGFSVKLRFLENGRLWDMSLDMNLDELILRQRTS